MLFLLLVNPALARQSNAQLPLFQEAEHFIRTQLAAQLQAHDRIEITINPIDSRLQLPACAHPLQFESSRPIKPGRVSLKTSCSGPKPWSLYLNGEVEIYRPVVINTLSIPRNTPLKPHALALEERPLSRLQQGHYTDIAAVSDHLARRDIRPHQVIQPKLLLPPLLVREGDKVVIRATAPGLTIETTGIALEDGRQGQQIDVRNSRSERVIRARVTERGIVSTR